VKHTGQQLWTPWLKTEQDTVELLYQLQTAVLLTLCGPGLQTLGLCLSDLQALEKALQQRQGKLWAVQLPRQLP